MFKQDVTRRRFLAGTTSAALGGCLASPSTPAEAFAAAKESTSKGSTSVTRPSFHSRHIPESWLNFNTAGGKAVKRNRLCDTLQPEMLKGLAEQGVDLIETRLAWWEMEPEPGRFDWSRFDGVIEQIERGGMKTGVMCWFQFPPEWYNRQHADHARFRCLEHNRDSTILSLWDPRTFEVYQRLLTAVAERYGDRLSYVYAMITGDFGEVCFPGAVDYYRFSSPHRHVGYWSGDVRARASFAAAMRKRYRQIGELNAAWGTRLARFGDDLMPRMPFAKNSLRHRHDYMNWCTGSLLSFTDRVCSLYREHFPSTTITVPVGCPDERLYNGLIKSQVVKIAAKHDMTARWTGCGFMRSFPLSNILARRAASAAHFYGAPFGTEAALILEKENAANGLYESLANAASQIHDDPQNILRAADVHRRLRPKLLVDPPDTPVAVFYPFESEKLEPAGFSMQSFMAGCAALRAVADYDICDSFMLRDGYLRSKTDLVIPSGMWIPEDTIRLMIDFAKQRGRLWVRNDAEVSVLYRDVKLDDLARRQGCKLLEGSRPGPNGLYRFDDWPRFEPFASLSAPDDEQSYWTIHREHISRFIPKRCDFEIRARKT